MVRSGAFAGVRVGHEVLAGEHEDGTHPGLRPDDVRQGVGHHALHRIIEPADHQQHVAAVAAGGEVLGRVIARLAQPAGV
ncbi:hypothetical protein [Alloyangia mangrovi]|uniref:hypothetical protein n=1 Tax=Alloyangia mangrovi TaxID=1779329 RepID=UPI0021A66A50|nr:hypothetical protein [Alloyangia mangrovi]